MTRCSVAVLACLVSFTAHHTAVAAAATPAAKSSQTFALASGHTAQVEGRRVVLFGADGAQLAANPRLARTEDEQGTCPSDGLQNISSSGRSFVIEQQTCSGWHFIHERLVFGYEAHVEGFVLQEFTRQYFDRRTATAEDPVRLAPEHFGELRFEHTDLRLLYRLEP